MVALPLDDAGMLRVKKSTKEWTGKNGKNCIVSTEKWVRQLVLESRVEVKKRKLLGP